MKKKTQTNHIFLDVAASLIAPTYLPLYVSGLMTNTSRLSLLLLPLVFGGQMDFRMLNIFSERYDQYDQYFRDPESCKVVAEARQRREDRRQAI